MPRPDREISVHRYFFEAQAMEVKKAIERMIKKDSLNDDDIQAVKGLVQVYETLTNLSKKTGERRQEDCSSTCCQALQEK